MLYLIIKDANKLHVIHRISREIEMLIGHWFRYRLSSITFMSTTKALEKKSTLILCAIHCSPDSKGSFQLRSEEEIEKIRLQKEELEKKRTATAWLGGSILSRDEGRRSHENLKAIPNSYPMDVIPTRDSGTSNISLPVIQVMFVFSSHFYAAGGSFFIFLI